MHEMVTKEKTICDKVHKKGADFACYNGIKYDNNCLACWKFNNKPIPQKPEDKFGIEQLTRRKDPNNQCWYYYFTLKIHKVDLDTIGNYSCNMNEELLEGTVDIKRPAMANLTGNLTVNLTTKSR